MNPRLIKFAVELQNSGYATEKKQVEFKIFKGDKKFFDLFKQPAKVTVPINKD